MTTSSPLRFLCRFALSCALLVSAALAGAQSPDTSSQLRQFDELLQANDTVQLIEQLRQTPGNSETLEWLRRRAEEGYVVPQYELGRRLFQTSPLEGLVWNMLANMNHYMDLNQCSDLKRTLQVRKLIRDYWIKAEPNQMLLWADAIDASNKKAYEQGLDKRSKQPPWWICAPGEANPPAERLYPKDVRQKKREWVWKSRVWRERNTAMEIRLDANLNPDHFRIRKLDEKYWKGKLNSDGDESKERYFGAAWIDDDHLLFGGYRILGELGGPLRYDPIFVWNLKTDEITKYAESGFGVCYFEGFVSYYATRLGKLSFVAGEFGKEKKEFEVPAKDVQWIAPGLSKTNERFKCRRTEPSKEPYMSRDWPLESGGTIKFNGEFKDPDFTATYYPEGGRPPVVFNPFEGLETSDRSTTLFPPKFSAYLDASWFAAFAGRYSERPLPIWILKTDGKVERHNVPTGPWSGTTIYSPAKGGWFFLTRYGVYFLTDDRHAKILAGRAQAIRVSPNGCRAAVSTPLGHGQGDPMWVIDLCEKGGQQ